ncbi:hypothetical protein AAG570_003308 [Ranatra chinensis]|uniref:Letm1 RBD domain-containing protein n=1 Tax=Ranatra chinensis TaxID=642074 RepID=A0ABD0YUV6_9HEMI
MHLAPRRLFGLASHNTLTQWGHTTTAIVVPCDKHALRSRNVVDAERFVSRRSVHTGIQLLGCEPLKPSSKVEETVTVLKEKVKQQAETSAPAPPTTATVVPAEPKKTLMQRVTAELWHYYHGFRLLFIDINVSRKLLWRVLQGHTLTRREHKLLIRTVGDLFRLVPFSVFIIVPFMEFTLPFFIKFFPGMLPSTFQTTSEKEDKIKQALKVKLEMAKFLQRTLDDMAVAGKGHSSQSAKEFAQFFEKVRTSGEMTTSEEIMKFSKLFEDEITLDSLPRPQLMALCRVLEMNPIGTTNFLRFQLGLKLRSLIADDTMIQREGIQSLSQAELQAACRARGMRASGVSEERLKAQLTQWLDLSLVKKVPPSLLLLSQAFMLPETTPTTEKLAATISALPDVVCTQTKAVIGEREGKVDNKTKIELIKEEMTKIKEERKEQQEEEEKLKLKEAIEKEETMVDPAPTLIDAALMEPALKAVLQDIKKTSISDRIADSHLTTKDLEALEQALDELGKHQKRLLVQEKELQELRQEMAEYQEDICDLQKVLISAGKELEVKESRAAQLLFRRVNKMISKMDNVLAQLGEKEQETQVDEPQTCPAEESRQESFHLSVSSSMLRIDDLIATIHKMEKDADSSRLKRIAEVLGKLDGDRDGIVKMETLFKVINMVGHENVKLSTKQTDELLDLIHKEESIELRDKLLKTLQKRFEQEAEQEAASGGDTQQMGKSETSDEASKKKTGKGSSEV